MAKASPAITSFNAGEFSPLMAARSDLKYYNSACKRISNFIPTVQGPARNRPGTKFVREIKDSGQRTWLRRFIFSKTQSYIIEFGHLYARFYTNHSIIESSPGVPYEIATPFTSASLTRTDGTLRLRFAQTGDVLYITSDGQYPVQKMIRLTATTFSIAALETTGGPFLDVDPDNAIVMYASAATGSVSITANAAIFTANHVGSLIFMEQRKADGIKAWEPGKAIALNDVRRSDGKNYQALNAATTGGVKPIHSSGSRYDGDTGVSWDFLEPGYGWAKITGFTSSTVVSATVLSRLPAGAVSAGNPTPRWAFSAFSTVEGYPDSVAFFRERLCFSKFLKLYMSASADYENFNRYDDGGLVTADMAIVTEIAAEETNNIVWMAGMSGALLVGTAGEEFSVSELTQSQAFGPGNVKVSRQTKHGSSYAGEAIVGEEIIFAQAAGRKVRSLTQAESVDIRWTSSDLTVLAEHVTVGGVTSIAYQQEPDSVIWCVKGDGALAGFTLNKEQDVRGWHPHFIGGVSDANGERAIVESIDVIPSGGADELWLIVRRRINGTTKRYVEYMAQQRNACDDYEDSFYVDSGITAHNTSGAALTPGVGANVTGTTDVLFNAPGVFDCGSVVLNSVPPIAGADVSIVYAVSANGVIAAGVSRDASPISTRAITWTVAGGLVNLGAMPNGDETVAVDISDDGAVVVGYSTVAGGTSDYREAWRWTAATGIVGLGLLAGRSGSQPHIRVSGDGLTVVGCDGTVSGEVTEAWRWTAATGKVSLGFLPSATSSVARAVSDDGSVIIGLCGGINRVFRWTAATGMVDIGSSDTLKVGLSGNGSVVVGSNAASPQVWRWTAATGKVNLGFLPGHTLSDISDTKRQISKDGSTIVGFSTGATLGTRRAFKWTEAGGMIDLGKLASEDYSFAENVSSDGSVVSGGSGGGAALEAVWRWTETGGMVAIGDINSATYNLNQYTYDISDSGAVVVGSQHGTGGTGIGFHYEKLPSPYVDLEIQFRYKRSSVACVDTSWGKGVAVITRCVDSSNVRATIASGFPDTNVIAGGNWAVETRTISGLGHLEGEVVSVFADGVVQPQRVVSGGSITLASPATKVHVGLPYRSLITPMPIEAGAADGTAMGKTKRISRAIIRFISTLSAKFGRSGTSQLDSIPSPAELRATMDVPTDLFSGDVVVSWPDGYDGQALITVVQDDPAPCIVAGVFPQINTQDNR